MTDAAVAIAAMLTKSYMKLGYSFNDGYPLDAMSVDVFEMLRERHPNVTIGQMQQAVNNGINGDYGEVKGLSPVDVVRFVKEYTTPKNVVNYQASEEKRPLLLNRDVRADRINLLQSLYEMWCKDTPILGFPAGDLIMFLWEEGMLLDVKQKEVQDRYIEVAKKQLAENVNIRQRQLAFAKGLDCWSIIPSENSDDVKRLSYKLVIYDFFNDCKEMDIKDLHELFNK